MMTFFGKFKFQIVTLILLLLVIGAAIGYFYYSQGVIQRLTEEKATLTVENEALRLTNFSLRVDAEMVRQETQRLNDALVDARERAQRQTRSVRQEDIAGDARRDARGTEQRLNEQTRSLFRSFEEISRNALD